MALTCEREARWTWTGEWRRASWTKVLGFAPGDERGTLQVGAPGEQRPLSLLSMLCVSGAGEGQWGKSVPEGAVHAQEQKLYGWRGSWAHMAEGCECWDMEWEFSG